MPSDSENPTDALFGQILGYVRVSTAVSFSDNWRCSVNTSWLVGLDWERGNSPLLIAQVHP